jgi:exodeoxyribonuclease V gamma subunit
LLPTVEDIVAAAQELLGTEPATSADVRVDLPGGRTLTGTVAGLRGDAVQATTFSRVAAKHRLAAWVRLLALTASDPGTPRRAVTVGKARQGDGITVARVDDLDPQDAAEHLAALVDLFDRALCEPLPMACKAAPPTPRPAATTATRTSRHGARGSRASTSPARTRTSSTCSRSAACAPTTTSRASHPADDERGRGWDTEEPSRFGRLALRLWTPLLGVEKVEDR